MNEITPNQARAIYVRANIKYATSEVNRAALESLAVAAEKGLVREDTVIQVVRELAH